LLPPTLKEVSMSDDTGELLEAPLVIEYAFNRTTGPVIGAFLTGLKVGRVLGIRDTEGRIVCPPVEYDPETGDPLTEMVEVGTEGEVTSWSWVADVRQDQPLTSPHALAFVRLDGADTSMLHVVDAPGPEAMSTGARVRIRWAAEPEGLITDIACFELAGGAA
jgi:uncharacterized protein